MYIYKEKSHFEVIPLISSAIFGILTSECETQTMKQILQLQYFTINSLTANITIGSVLFFNFGWLSNINIIYLYI